MQRIESAVAKETEAAKAAAMTEVAVEDFKTLYNGIMGREYIGCTQPIRIEPQLI